MLIVKWFSWNLLLFCKLFSDFFFQDQDQNYDQDQNLTMKFILKSYAPYTEDTHQIWCCFAKFLLKSKSCSGSGSGWWFYFGFQYQTYISYIEDTHEILFGSGNSFESYCVHSKSQRTYSQTDRQTRNFFCLFCVLNHTKHEHSSKEENFFFTHAITILCLFTYCVCDEKVKGCC